MNTTLSRRLQALEAIRGRGNAADSPAGRAVNAAFRQLLVDHDRDGTFAARLADAATTADRAAVLVDLLEVAGPVAHRRVMDLIATAHGRAPLLT